jgi:hypothetical protein
LKLNSFYSFVDRDMFMRYRGGGLGHPTREATQVLEESARYRDSPIPTYDPLTGEGLDSVDDMDVGVDDVDDGNAEDDNESVRSWASRRSLDAVPEDYDDTDVETDDE